MTKRAAAARVRFQQVPAALVKERYWYREFTLPEWPGDHHTFWLVLRGDDVVGFCSAVVNAHRECFFSSAAVFRGGRGAGIQRRMVQHRLRWAKRHGATHALTYTVPYNWPSIVNLLRCGFTVYDPAYAWAGRVVYFQKALQDGAS